MQPSDKYNDSRDVVNILLSYGHETEKKQIVIRAIMDNQIKILNVCRQKWGEDYYYKIVPEC
jgi:hypothetical protein